MNAPARDLAPLLSEFALSVLRDSPRGPLSRTAASTLSLLERGGPQRITQLAEREAVSQPAMTGLIQRMESSALVTRLPDPADARASLVDITDDGRQALATRRRVHEANLSARLERLSPSHLTSLEHAAAALTELTETHAHSS